MGCLGGVIMMECLLLRRAYTTCLTCRRAEERESRADKDRGRADTPGSREGGGMFGISNFLAIRRDSMRLWWVGVPRLISARRCVL